MADEQPGPEGYVPRPAVLCESCGVHDATKTLRVRDQYDKRLCTGCAATYEGAFGDAVREVD